jgi:hypothetical protein
VSLAVFCYATRDDEDTIDLDEEEERAELIPRLLGQLPNLCDIDIDIVSASQSAAIIDNLSSRHELRKLCLAGGREFVLPPKQISRLLRNYTTSIRSSSRLCSISLGIASASPSSPTLKVRQL